MGRRPGLQTLRLNKMLTQEELAKAVGVSVQAVQAWEAGTNQPRPGTQRKLVQVLGVAPEDVLDALEETARMRQQEEVKSNRQDT